MLKAITFCLKLAIFSFLILVLGNWLRWDGKTISDQVKVKMAHAERSDFIGAVRGWAEEITSDARKGIQKKFSHPTQPPQIQEEISSSERQKLKALIRELNSSRKKD